MEAKLEIEIVGVARLKTVGSENFVMKNREWFQEKYGTIAGSLPPTCPNDVSSKVKQPKKDGKPGGEKPKGSQKHLTVEEIYSTKSGEFLSALDVYETPSSHAKKCALYTFIISEVLKIEEISVNHIYSCYRLAEQSPPNIKQAVRDAKKKNWLIHDSWDEIQVHTTGLISIPKFEEKAGDGSDK